MTDYIKLKDLDFTFFGKGAKMTGSFHLHGPTHLSSIMEGELFMQENTNLCIEKNGRFKGTIHCHNIEIYGKFEGILESTGKITIYPSAFVKGKISSKDLIVYPGAILNIDGHADLRITQ